MTIERVGYGAGDRDDPSTPNVLRVLIGRAADARGTPSASTVIECEIDDMNPQIFGVAMERLYAAGALEVFYVPVQMKKNRPGTLLTVVVPPGASRVAIADIIFRETTTIGLRYSEVDRECLRARDRRGRDAARRRARSRSRGATAAWSTPRPEFEDCATLAAAHQPVGQGSAGDRGARARARSAAP